MTRDAKIVSLARQWQAANPSTELDSILAGATIPPVRFAAFGDSITTPAGGTKSWVNWLDQEPLMDYVGGYSMGGYRSYQVAAATTPVVCDVAVVMVGTNDIGPAPWGTDQTLVLTSIRDIVVASQAPAAIVSAIAPRNNNAPAGTSEAQRTLEHNARVKSYCATMGWTFVDPWVTLRAADGQWAHPTLTYDGIHPEIVSAQRYVRDVLFPLRQMFW